VLIIRHKPSPAWKLKLRDAFLDRATRDTKEVFVVRLGKSTIAFRDVESDARFNLVGLMVVTSRKLFG